jgi:hypothetical protein
VRITLGTDGNRPWDPHEEMEDMVIAGMTPKHAAHFGGDPARRRRGPRAASPLTPQELTSSPGCSPRAGNIRR